MYPCLLCEFKTEVQKNLITHIDKIHNHLKYEEYILKYYFNDVRPTCKCGCGTELKFYSHLPTFFKEYTRNHFPRCPHTEENKNKIKQGVKKAFTEKYGVDNPMKIPEFIQKIADTKENKYGDSKYNNIQKTLDSKLEKYGDPTFSNPKKSAKTNIDKYGFSTFSQTQEWKVQVKNTKLEKYGDANYVNIEKIKKTKLDKYGFDCEFTNPEWRKLHNKADTPIQLKTISDIECDKYNYHGYEFDGKFYNFLIEIDGDSYYAKNLHNLTLTQITTAQNDYKKTKIVVENNEFQLLRIGANFLKKINRKISFEDIWELSYEQDFTFNLDTVFLNKEYLQNYIYKFGENNLRKYHGTIFRFIKLFQPTSPINSFEITNLWNNSIVMKTLIYELVGLNGTASQNISLTNIINLYKNKNEP